MATRIDRANIIANTVTISRCRKCNAPRPLRGMVRDPLSHSVKVTLACCGVIRHATIWEDVFYQPGGTFLDWAPDRPWSWRDLDGNTHAVDLRIGPHFWIFCSGTEQRSARLDETLDDGNVTCIACLGEWS